MQLVEYLVDATSPGRVGTRGFGESRPRGRADVAARLSQSRGVSRVRRAGVSAPRLCGLGAGVAPSNERRSLCTSRLDVALG